MVDTGADLYVNCSNCWRWDCPNKGKLAALHDECKRIKWWKDRKDHLKK